jgi:hypothetical protein
MASNTAGSMPLVITVCSLARNIRVIDLGVLHQQTVHHRYTDARAHIYLFLVHTFTSAEPFVRPSLFRDRNFAAGTLFIAIVGLTYYASMALQPPYLQGLMHYPVVTAGLVMGPRGVGTMAAMIVVGHLVGRVDTRLWPSVSRSWPGLSMT